jgi:hypothetical protein
MRKKSQNFSAVKVFWAYLVGQRVLFFTILFCVAHPRAGPVAVEIIDTG